MNILSSDAVVRTFKYRLLPSKKQHDALEKIRESQRILYNAGKQEREDCYRKTGNGRDYMDQCKAVTELRQEPEFCGIPANIQRCTLKRLDKAFKGFFRRAKTGHKAGYPRYKGKDRWSSFGFAEFCGITLRDGRLRFKGMPGSLHVHFHRPMQKGKILGCIFKRDLTGWSVIFHVRVGIEKRALTGNQIGIDMGITTLAALSDGTIIPNARAARNAERKMRITQRSLARCKRGSNRRKKVKLRLTKLHRKIANTRATHLHQVSAKLVRENDFIAIEALNVKGLSQGILAREVHDASWGELTRMLKYKAEKAGVSVVEVKAAGTSQTCPECGQVAKKALAQRVHRCDCGCVMDRDHAAAKIVLQRARSGALVPKRRAA